MPVLETQILGRIPYNLKDAVEFPRGLPGFEDRRRFVARRVPEIDPLIFLQSLEDPGLCFTTIPVLAVEPAYRLAVSAEDRALLGLPANRPLRIGEDVLCLAVLSIRETGPTANLLAPIVVNPRSHKAVQAILPESGYSHQQVLLPSMEVAPCS